MGWVVLKYGGTSVARAENWGRIAQRAREVCGPDRVCIVASALSGVSDGLERAIAAAVAGDSLGPLEAIERQHQDLADALNLPVSARSELESLLGDLRRLLEGIRLTNEASPRLRARVMSFGELASTRLGIEALKAAGLDAEWFDARTVLRASPSSGPDGYLSASVPVDRAPERVSSAAPILLTQGFIARNPEGHTVLLGRGGSDTSAALFGALLEAERVEIWTDVHGMFTADPREIPTSRLIRRLDYREAQELAAMGAKVLHPRSLIPVAEAGIPLEIRNTLDPQAVGTTVQEAQSDDPAVTAVVRRRGVTLLTLSTLAMWGTPGFLAKAFAPFADLGMSVDLVATSQSAVSVTLDHIPGGVDGPAFRELLRRLGEMGEVRLVQPAAVVSIVGRRIRAVLHELGGALEVFREHDVHLVSESSEDLNLSFVVNEADAQRLTARLHGVLFKTQSANPRLGPTWEELQQGQTPVVPPVPRWWMEATRQLHTACPEGEARYIYHLPTVSAAAHALRSTLTHAGQLFYAMKANPHPAILGVLAEAQFGMECVSIGEVQRVRDVLGFGVPILFTPNFCPTSEYAKALELGAEITVDGPEVFDLAPDTFSGIEVAVRVDPGGGAGHHAKVVTAGAQAKFGHPVGELPTLIESASARGCRIVGLHAHVGSGILDASAWMRTGSTLVDCASALPHLEWIDLGGGLGVVERTGQVPLDLDALNQTLAALSTRLAEGIELRMEPGRYLVSAAGVLAARVTQVRRKGSVRFVGLATGMNSLIRPSLYGAWHGIHNVTRLGDAPAGYAHVVGPICETGDILGRDRLLPETIPGDLVVIDNAGAYGHSMASRYNDRLPAQEVVLP